jgi:hypothetical protein
MDALKILSLVLYISLSTLLPAQNVLISGRVQDSDTYSPISNVNISFADTRLGCTTGLNGEFSIIIDTLPVYMIISHLGYETKQIWLEKGMAGINILLSPYARILTEVEITASRKPESFYKDDHYTILDFTVDHTLVYLLLYRYWLGRAELICKSENGEIIAHSGPLSFKPSRLFTDCLGYTHVLGPDSAYQVYLNKDTLLFPYKASLEKFKSTMSDCIASTSDWLFFREQSFDNQSVSFYQVNRKNSNKKEINTITDIAQLRSLRNQPYDYYLLTMDTLPNGYNQMIEWNWVNKIQYKQNRSVLEKVGDTLAIFNTVDGAIELYNLNGYFLSRVKIPVDRSKKEKWTESILVDQFTGRSFTTFYYEGRINLYRIDLSNGSLTKAFTVKHNFPQKIMVHNNFIYYLYDVPATMDNKQLFRERL